MRREYDEAVRVERSRESRRLARLGWEAMEEVLARRESQRERREARRSRERERWAGEEVANA
jgi:hypothetical protein